MKAAQNRRGDDAVAVANAMPGLHWREVRGVRNAGSEAAVRTSAIVMRDPLPQNAAEVILVEQNHPVETLAANRANHALAERVRLRRSRRRLEDRESHRRQRLIDTVCVNAVVVVNEEAMLPIIGH